MAPTDDRKVATEVGIGTEASPLESATLSVGHSATFTPDADTLALQSAMITVTQVADGPGRFQFMTQPENVYLGNPISGSGAEDYGVEYAPSVAEEAAFKQMRVLHRELMGPVTAAAVEYGTEFVKSGGPVGPSLHNNVKAGQLTYTNHVGTAYSQNTSSIRFVSAHVTAAVCDQLRAKGIEIANSPLVVGHISRDAAGEIVRRCEEAGIDPGRSATVKRQLERNPELNVLALVA